MILLAALLLFQVPGWFDSASCTKDYYWRVAYRGPCKTRKDLDKVLALHKQWIESRGLSGKRADLHGAILSSDELKNVDLWGADLGNSVLAGADLAGAVLGPNRQGAARSKASPGSWVIGAPGFLSGQTVNENGVAGSPAPFPVPTDLKRSVANDVDFHDADLSSAQLQYGDLRDADLSDADLTGANLSHAFLIGTDLDRANFSAVDLFQAVLEPKSVNGLTGLESARHLWTVTFDTNPSGLIQLRKLMRDEGFQEQERQLTYALNRRQAELDSLIERWFKEVAFDLTCRYGLSPGRCLRLVFLLWVFFSAFFYLAIHRRGWMLLRVTRHLGYRDKTREVCMWHGPDAGSNGMKKYFARLKFELRVIRASIFFSLVNAFSIGYREFSIGQWVLLLSNRQYQIRPTKWARTLAGVQSLLTVYLFALWLLTYFGRPFG